MVDEHPDYASSWLGERLATERGGRLLRVQHHLAHAAAVLAEHGAFPVRAGERGVALVLDGTGFGRDGTTWGCEWLTLDADLGWRRPATAGALPLVGAERAVREPWRVAVAALVEARGASLVPELRPEWSARASDLRQLLSRDLWPRARGAGRLFEAAGALFGLCDVNTWEGEAAARFEALAATAQGGTTRWTEVALSEETHELPGGRLLLAAARRLLRGADRARTALGFHHTFAALAAELSLRVLGPGVPAIALAGGCLVNRHLRRLLRSEHARLGLDVLLPREVPAGDGGLAYGQAVLAAAALKRSVSPRYRGGV